MQDHDEDLPGGPDHETTLAHHEHGIQQVLEIAVTAAQLASAVSLQLHQLGALAPKQAEAHAMLSRHLGELLQAAGADDIAAEFGARAALLSGGKRQN